MMNATGPIYTCQLIKRLTNRHLPKAALNNLQRQHSAIHRVTAPTHLETSAPTKDQIIQRYTNILVYYFAMSFRSIIVTINCHRSYNLDTGSVGRNNYNASLVICTLVVRVAFSKHQVQFGSGVTCATYEPVCML